MIKTLIFSLLITMIGVSCNSIHGKIEFEEMQNYSSNVEDYYHPPFFKSSNFLITFDSTRILDRKTGKLFGKKHKAIYDNRANCVILKIGSKWGAIKDNYEEFIPFIHDSLGLYQDHSGIFDKTALSLSVKNGLYGFYNLKGKLIIPHSYQWAENRYTSHAIVKDKNKFSLLSHKGEELIPPIYDTIYRFVDTINYCVSQNGKFGLVNVKNKRVIPCVNDSLSFLMYLNHDRNGNYYAFYNFETKQRWGIYDVFGEIVIPPISESKFKYLAEPELKARMKAVNELSRNSVPEFYYSLKQNGKVGIINSFGKIIVQPEFDSLINYGYSYRDKVILFKKGNDTIPVRYARKGLKLELLE